MKATVIRAFYDMQDPKETVYQVGDAFEGDARRIAELEKGDFVKKAVEKKPARAKKEA